MQKRPCTQLSAGDSKFIVALALKTYAKPSNICIGFEFFWQTAREIWVFGQASPECRKSWMPSHDISLCKEYELHAKGSSEVSGFRVKRINTLNESHVRYIEFE